MSLGIKTLEGVVEDVQVDIYTLSEGDKPSFKYDYAYSLDNTCLEYSLESTKRNTLKGDYVVVSGVEKKDGFKVICAYNLNSEESTLKPSPQHSFLIAGMGLFLLILSLSNIDKLISLESLFIVPLLGIMSYASYGYIKETIAQKVLFKRVQQLEVPNLKKQQF